MGSPKAIPVGFMIDTDSGYRTPTTCSNWGLLSLHKQDTVGTEGTRQPLSPSSPISGGSISRMTFVGSCLHCLATEPGAIIPRPLGHALHETEPKKLLYFDFCFMSPGVKNNNYVLVLKDDFSGYVWLKATTATTAEVAGDHLIEWFDSFGHVQQWVSGQGTHFKNDLVDHLHQKIMREHNFALAYCPWSNGTVEVFNCELLRATRALLSEYQPPHNEWPLVLPVVQSVLSNTILELLGGRFPLTLFTKLPHDTPLISTTRRTKKKLKVHTIDEVRAAKLTNATKLHNSLDEIHKEVLERTNEQVDSYNHKTNVRSVNFSVGDFFLRGARQHGRKPQVK